MTPTAALVALVADCLSLRFASTSAPNVAAVARAMGEVREHMQGRLSAGNVSQAVIERYRAAAEAAVGSPVVLMLGPDGWSAQLASWGAEAEHAEE